MLYSWKYSHECTNVEWVEIYGHQLQPLFCEVYLPKPLGLNLDFNMTVVDLFQ